MPSQKRPIRTISASSAMSHHDKTWHMDFSDIQARTGKNTDTRLSLFYTQLSITDATPALSALFLTGTKIADYPLQDPPRLRHDPNPSEEVPS
jgi:hypothetical protein